VHAAVHDVSRGEESANLFIGDIPVDDSQTVRRQNRRELVQTSPTTLT
jgi:hypothetical protein